MKKRKRRPKPIKICGEIVLEFAESRMGGTFVSLFSNLLPNSDIRKLSKRMDEMLEYLEQQKGRK